MVSNLSKMTEKIEENQPPRLRIHNKRAKNCRTWVGPQASLTHALSGLHQLPTGLAWAVQPKLPVRTGPLPAIYTSALSSLPISGLTVNEEEKYVHRDQKTYKKKILTQMATNGEENQAGRHQEVGHKSLLQSDALYQVYI
jgi:hypothetical protein